MAEEETTPEGTVEEPTEEAKTEVPEQYKEIQRTLAKREQELASMEKEMEILKAQQPNREIAEALAEMTRQQGELFERIEELGKRQEAAEKGEEYKPTPSPTREARRQRQVADEILAEHGFSPLDARFRDARKDADPVRAVNRRIREVYQEEKSKGQEDIEKVVEERVKEQYQQYLKDHAGDFKVEGGGPSGGAGSEDQWIKDYAAGKHNTPQDHLKAKQILDKMK